MKYKINKLIIPLMLISLIIFLSSFVISAQTNLGTFKQGEDILLVQLCGDCTYNNITSVYSPNSTELITNIQMTKDGTKYTYNLDGGNTSQLGTYSVNGVGNLGGNTQIWSYTLEVTPNGESLTISKVIIQIGLLSSLILFFVISLIGIFNIDHYIGKFALYWISHILFIAITFISWQMSGDFLVGTPMITGMFKIAFYFIMISSFPMIILSLSWIFYIHLMNDDIKKMMDRGMDEGEAYDRSRRKRRW